MDTSKTYIEQKEAQLAHWQGRVDELVQAAAVASETVKRDMQFEADDLKAKCAAVRERLETLKARGDEHWETLADHVESAWKELDAAFKNQTDGR